MLYLETLSVNGDYREEHIVRLALLDSSFPALRTLELLNLHWANLRYLFEFVPLVHLLTKIRMVHANDNGFWHYAPLLTNLAVDYGGHDSTATLCSD